MKKEYSNISLEERSLTESDQVLAADSQDQHQRKESFLSRHIPPVAGMGVVEVILITVVLISLVIIFQNNIKTIVDGIFKTMSSNVGQIH